MFAALESALIARLQAEVPAARAVQSAGELADIAEASQVTPALHVVLAGYAVPDQSLNSAVIRTTWYVVCVTRNAVAARQGAGARKGREQVAELFTPVVEALLGWRPGVLSASPVELVSAPSPAFQNGFGYLPIAIATDIILTRTQP